MNNYLHDMFIDEAKPALNKHSGSGGSYDGEIDYSKIEKIVTDYLIDNPPEFDSTNVDLTGYAKTDAIPTKVSQLSNDSKLVSESALEESKKLNDTVTGDFYSLSVVNGKLTLTKLED